MVSYLKQINLQRKRVIRDLLPDTCTVYPSMGTTITISSGGIATSNAPVARTWVNPYVAGFVATSAIPCRIDPSRSQQPERLKVQTVVADQYYINLPHNLTILPTDHIHVNGHKYEIVKLDVQGVLSLTTVALITELSVDDDA